MIILRQVAGDTEDDIPAIAAAMVAARCASAAFGAAVAGALRALRSCGFRLAFFGLSGLRFSSLGVPAAAASPGPARRPRYPFPVVTRRCCLMESAST